MSEQETVEIVEKSGTLERIDEIEEKIRRVEKLAEKLERVRTLAVATTVPSDWQLFGKTLYLEGDGGLRMAPLLGIHNPNTVKEVERSEDGEVAVTITMDGESLLFGTRVYGVSRRRTSRDPFLTQNGKIKDADIGDVENAAWKGAYARLCQLLAGLSGLTPEEMKSRFGMTYTGEGVKFRESGATEQKKAEAASPEIEEKRKEVEKMLRELATTPAMQADILEGITKSDKWAGKRDPAKLTEKGVLYAFDKLKKMVAEREEDERGR